MEIIIFIGIQATGKTTFYKQYFLNSHFRISLDLLKTRNREEQFLELCFKTQQKIIIDNTNPTIADRLKYINLAKENKYKIIGYFFQSKIADAINRNNSRTGKELIPEIGIKGTFSKLELPSIIEGFDDLKFVEISAQEFIIQNWKNEI